MDEAPRCLAPDPDLIAPDEPFPEGATDCHCHIYALSDCYPLTPVRTYTPAEATLDQYLAMCRGVGFTRTVQVSASVYGYDNSLTRDVIARLGQGRARGVAGVPPDAAPAELSALHDAGFRGVRLSTHLKGYGGLEALRALSGRLQPLGWHIQLHLLHVDELAALESELMAIPVPIVFDHMAGVRGDEGPLCPGFQTLLRLLRARDDFWVKISSWYRRSQSGLADNYADMRGCVQALVDARPDRLVYGSNWPHPNLFHASDMPNDGQLTNVFNQWVPDGAVRHRILVENPAQLYGFES